MIGRRLMGFLAAWFSFAVRRCFGRFKETVFPFFHPNHSFVHSFIHFFPQRTGQTYGGTVQKATLASARHGYTSADQRERERERKRRRRRQKEQRNKKKKERGLN